MMEFLCDMLFESESSIQRNGVLEVFRFGLVGPKRRVDERQRGWHLGKEFLASSWGQKFLQVNDQ